MKTIFRNYSLTLVDSLDTLVVLGDFDAFKTNVDYVIKNVNFDQPFSVNVFEVTIRVLGALLSAHELITDQEKTFSLTYPDYDNGLLRKAVDLGKSFKITTIPYHKQKYSVKGFTKRLTITYNL